MNNKGTVAIFLFMMGTIFFLLGLALAPALTQTGGEAQADLDCTNSSISNQDKAVCYQMDSYAPLYTGLLFGLGGVVLGRLLMG